MPRPSKKSPADKHLIAADPVLAKIVARHGPYALEADSEGTHFRALFRTIVFQQLAGKAAETIWGRLEKLFRGKPGGRSGGGPPATGGRNGGCPPEIGPKKLLALDDETLRGAGLSRQKIGYARDLAAKIVAGEVDLDALDGAADEAVIEALTRVKGIGEWTAQIFLMFRLGRPDVLPVSDFGVRKAIMLAYGLEEMPPPKEVARIGEAWRPHSTTAAWYLWRSLDNP